ncbi:Ser/Thr protein phosphatase, putative [Trichomonas vaginalis G3]|uniref:Serine/threonine-protein phosphatase n=1 Tax=Trichomonas vaginalis (strain ATCC PRA-98 / G3) TaxID=412133 RepID=A2GBE1_TRIV3|nr:phosphoprotein phosphatase protein [Trichomonas vaginalis G3]EAX85527.1 Ser/Thr protein phosphatase, putative [Trichomonas vaginalis G3]KAI5494571.1 phosphoprotein phosphatase protein [Trichomonas vaginalis G3]|eukprot:XP_001298457.1 Ser/Thr protein phosphatase [Trichomonas vaginalis G3]
MDIQKALYRTILDNYMNIMNTDLELYTSKAKILKLPMIPPNVLIQLTRNVTDLFKKEPNIVTAPPNTVVVGDIHGHIMDLFRILKKFHLPSPHSYVFLGDYVDRGEFSTETITLIYILKVLYPTRVFLIRGNHEFPEMCDYGGFAYEAHCTYGTDDISSAFNESFFYMPLAAIIDNYAFCIHGGLGADFKMISQLEQLRRPIFETGNPIINDALWSDPTDETDTLETSPRGLGYLFGQVITYDFIRHNKIDIIIRGHQCVDGGIEKLHENKIFTVFSASKYCGENNNKAGALLVKMRAVEEFTFPPFPYLRRVEASFVPISQKKAVEAPVCSKKTMKGISPMMSTPNLPSMMSTPTLPTIKQQPSRYMALFEQSIKCSSKDKDTPRRPNAVHEPENCPPKSKSRRRYSYNL